MLLCSTGTTNLFCSVDCQVSDDSQSCEGNGSFLGDSQRNAGTSVRQTEDICKGAKENYTGATGKTAATRSLAEMFNQAGSSALGRSSEKGATKSTGENSAGLTQNKNSSTELRYLGRLNSMKDDIEPVYKMVEVENSDDDSLNNFIVESEEENQENLEPELESNEEVDSDVDVGVSSCHNRHRIASDSEGSQLSDSGDETPGRGTRKGSRRIPKFEEKKAALRDMFQALRRSAKKPNPAETT